MKILFVLGIGIAVLSLMGTGILATSGNSIDLWVQAIGWGEGNLESPINTAKADILLDTIPPENEEDDPITFVSGCGFHSDEDIPIGTGKSDGLIICKLLNEFGQAIAEGEMILTEIDETGLVYEGSETLIIDINQPITEDATLFDRFFDMKVVIEAPL